MRVARKLIRCEDEILSAIHSRASNVYLREPPLRLVLLPEDFGRDATTAGAALSVWGLEIVTGAVLSTRAAGRRMSW